MRLYLIPEGQTLFVLNTATDVNRATPELQRCDREEFNFQYFHYEERAFKKWQEQKMH